MALTGDGDTLLTGALADQAALHGLLRKVRNLGIPLVSINEIHPEISEVADRCAATSEIFHKELPHDH